jgi:UDP-3-O-[3-hydroxymyristoyl] N-acetylglucosamine deacetylase
MRRTLSQKAEITGVGLHKGRPSSIVFLPAAGATGIRFFTPDLTDPIDASLANIAATVRGTNLSNGSRVLYTVEHVLSACAGLAIDDLDIAMTGEEPPACDGSALPFSKAFMNAGLADKPEQERRPLILEQPLECVFEKASYKASPSDAPFFKMTFTHPHPLIGAQTFELALTPASYLKEVAPARTFGFKNEVAGLRAAGLALGGSLENSVIIDDNAFLSAEGRLRFPDELARHKLLDLIGDLALTGLALDKLRVEADYTGHKSNVNFAKLLMDKRKGGHK